MYNMSNVHVLLLNEKIKWISVIFFFFMGGGGGEGVYLNINKSLVTGYVEQEGLFYCILVDLGDNLKFLIHSSINII